MSQPELLKKVVATLEAIGVPYMVTGSLASSLQGQPRSTHDIDLVVAVTRAAASALAAAFPAPDYYLDAEAIASAIAEGSMFNLIDIQEGDRVDFWVLTGDPFDQTRFSRRRTEAFHGMRLHVSSPEDTILMKLKWAALSGGSEKQFNDALHVYEIQYGSLDLEYLESWAVSLDVEALWQRVKTDADIPGL